MSEADEEQGIEADMGQGSDPAIIGLTGPIGCGKTTVAGMLGELGGTVIDADALARDVTGPGQPALAAIRARFGDGVFERSGVLDRAALGAVVFSRPRRAPGPRGHRPSRRARSRRGASRACSA